VTSYTCIGVLQMLRDRLYLILPRALNVQFVIFVVMPCRSESVRILAEYCCRGCAVGECGFGVAVKPRCVALHDEFKRLEDR